MSIKHQILFKGTGLQSCMCRKDPLLTPRNDQCSFCQTIARIKKGSMQTTLSKSLREPFECFQTNWFRTIEHILPTTQIERCLLLRRHLLYTQLISEIGSNTYRSPPFADSL